MSFIARTEDHVIYQLLDYFYVVLASGEVLKAFKSLDDALDYAYM
ncbi:MAG: hypothetical protein QXT77_08700 [Candidatus Methanomethylicaceae archaeon]